MLSLATAQKLKKAGLQWKPAFGDLFYWQDEENYWEMDVLRELDIKEATSDIDECIDDWVFAPRLEQMLDYIEKSGRSYDLKKSGTQSRGRYCLLLYEWDEQMEEIDFGVWWMPWAVFYDEGTPEEVAAAALLWIIEQEGGGTMSG